VKELLEKRKEYLANLKIERETRAARVDDHHCQSLGQKTQRHVHETGFYIITGY
jgi:hypothetical protein